MKKRCVSCSGFPCSQDKRAGISIFFKFYPLPLFYAYPVWRHTYFLQITCLFFLSLLKYNRFNLGYLSVKLKFNSMCFQQKNKQINCVISKFIPMMWLLFCFRIPDSEKRFFRRFLQEKFREIVFFLFKKRFLF